MNKRNLTIAGATAALLLGVTASAATADVPDADGTIHGCYKPTGLNHGQLLVVDTDVPESCPAGYQPLSWPTEASATTFGRQTVTNANQPGTTATATCPTGKVAISGGYHWDGIGSSPFSNFHLAESRPTDDGTGWQVSFQPASPTVDVYVVCVNE